MIKIFRNTKSKLPKKWKILINAIKEIESILHTTFLDIEFGITKKNQVMVFQVRPLTSIREKTPRAPMDTGTSLHKRLRAFPCRRCDPTS